MWIKRTLRNGRGLTLTLFLVAVMAGGIALAEGEKADPAEEARVRQQAEPEATADAEQPTEHTYPLGTCIVSGGKLGSMGDAVIYEHEGREIRFCCDRCVEIFEKDPEKYLKKLDEARRQQAAAPYPLNTCLVSGAQLGSMGEPVTYVHEGQEIKFCCAGCIGSFKSDPEKYMKQLKAAKTGESKKTEEHGSCGGH